MAQTMPAHRCTEEPIALPSPMWSKLPDMFSDEVNVEVKFDRTTSGVSTEIPEGSEGADQACLADLEDHSPLLASTPMPFQSRLALWAQGVVHAEEYIELAWARAQGSPPLPSDVVCDFNLEPLRSELGLRAQADICISEIASAQRRRQPLRDGPALTADGRALDLEEGAPLFFSSSASNEARASKIEALALRKRRSEEAAAEAASRIDSELACAVDAAGVVYGRLPTGDDEQGAETCTSTRLRVLRRKVLSRRQRPSAHDLAPLAVRPDGRLVLLLAVGPSLEARLRTEAKREMLKSCSLVQSQQASEPMPIDSEGCMHLD